MVSTVNNACLRPVASSIELRQAYSCFPSGVTAVCALKDGKPIGMAASAFVPASLDPPLVSLCIQRSSSTWPKLRVLPRLGISFLGEMHDTTARQLSAQAADRFEGVDWVCTAEGAIFIRGATAWLDCSIEQELPAGDHELILFRIQRLNTQPQVGPLIFHRSGFHLLQGGRTAG
jgi:flavin reductase (DIM6/NTAB) family NADH-FMN oxidoreductase RutF